MKKKINFPVYFRIKDYTVKLPNLMRTFDSVRFDSIRFRKLEIENISFCHF